MESESIPKVPINERLKKAKLNSALPKRHYNRKKRSFQYNPDVHIPIAFYVIFLGGTQQEVANRIGISARVLGRWKNKYPDFAATLNNQMSHLLGDTAGALIKRAMGYICEDKEIYRRQHVMKDGQIVDTVDERTIIKQYPPDVGAIVCVLANRDSENWRRSDSPTQGMINDKERGLAPELPTDYLEDIIRSQQTVDPVLIDKIDHKGNYFNEKAIGANTEFLEKLKTMVIHKTDTPS